MQHDGKEGNEYLAFVESRKAGDRYEELNAGAWIIIKCIHCTTAPVV
jgi:hypothetical protein